jgi:hypothetical protein
MMAWPPHRLKVPCWGTLHPCFRDSEGRVNPTPAVVGGIAAGGLFFHWSRG